MALHQAAKMEADHSKMTKADFSTPIVRLLLMKWVARSHRQMESKPQRGVSGWEGLLAAQSDRAAAITDEGEGRLLPVHRGWVLEFLPLRRANRPRCGMRSSIMEAVLKEEHALDELIKEAPQEEVAPVVVIAGPPHSVCFETPALKCGLPVKDEHLLVMRTPARTLAIRTTWGLHAYSLQSHDISTNTTWQIRSN